MKGRAGMRRKVVMIVAAGLCGIVGTALLVNFVRGAESRALAGEELVEVYRAVERIPSGTAASQMVAVLWIDASTPSSSTQLPALAKLMSITVLAVDQSTKQKAGRWC